MISTSTTANTTTTMMMIQKKIFWILLTMMAILIWNSVDALSMISNNNHSKPIPITVLSGFLGSGKTTLLQNMLQNKEGLKIAIIVNDVASVNIDSKLVAGAGAGGGMSTDGQLSASSDGLVELQNGCACCSLSDELLTSVSRLVTMSDLRGEDDQFDHIVVELSGVADPKSVRAKFQEAVMEQMPLLDRVQLDTMVTLIDASTFESHFKSTAQANREETPELYYRDGETPTTSNENEDDVELLEPWMKDLPPKLLEVVMAEINGQRSAEEEDVGGVAELLVSQTETADLVVINKDDLVSSPEELSRLQDIIKALNPRAQIVTTSYGQLSIQSVLAIGCAKGVVVAGAVDDHRDYVNAASNAIEIDNIDDKSSSHSHSSHDHDHRDDVNDNNNNKIIEDTTPDTTITTTSHSHSAHSHDHHDEQREEEDSKDSTDITSSHSHSHSHGHHDNDDSSCTDPECTDTSHSHTHSHDHSSSSSSCDDPDCTDPSHSHSHSHSHSDGGATTTHAGIGSFVFRARRPFHPGRLVAFLRYLPVVRGIPEAAADDHDDHEKNEKEKEKEKVVVSEQARIALLAVLRSKGFIWCANSHNDAIYWSHAGSSFDLSCLGSWWATLPRNQWPPGVEEYVLQDFDVPEHDDETNPVGVGDRRQEVVFIGQGLQDTVCQTEISNALRQCLLDDDEYDEYQSICKEIGIDYESKLRTRFANLIDSKIVAY